ncbi:MAG: tetratricopeptide repeat protein [Bryobacteraceae bacterium]
MHIIVSVIYKTAISRLRASQLAIAAVIPAMVWMTYWPLRLAWADRLSRSSDAATVARAVRMSPGDADLRLRLADAQQAAGIDPTSALEAAAKLDPASADTWIRLGLAAEMRGDLRAAETRLLEASRVSQQFAPRWALANYYFRRADAARFWPWAKAAMAIGSADLSGVFRLCWNMTQNAALIERAIPGRGEVLNAYVLFLLAEGRLPASEQAAAKLAMLATRDDQSTLIYFCNRQIDAGSWRSAVEVWNTLCARHLLPYAPIDPARAPLTDGNFAAPIGNAGFAWREPATPGVTIGQNESPPYLWVTFSGDQPETCAPLMQFVPVAPGASYRLKFEYRTLDLPSPSGLRLSVFNAPSGNDLVRGSPWLSSPDWQLSSLHFEVPAAGIVRVALTCQRQPGSTRIEGSLELRHVLLERAP